MHVDGFRFDLASTLNRGQFGKPLNHSGIVQAMSHDPILAHTKLIAEPWDAAGMYQVGSFYPHTKRWSEWNGKYRDDVRRFINGQEKSKGSFATRLSGSQDLYGHHRSPTSSINFIISHDGFTLADLVSYNGKHNEGNGEENRDGTNDNYSWNCGIEGETRDKKVLKLRLKQMKNFFVALLISQGVPMFLMGDEYGHTKKGNNNTYCQDNRLNWFLWDKLANSPLYPFVKKMIALRKENKALLQRTAFLTSEDVSWHKANGEPVDWHVADGFLAFTLFDGKEGKHLYIAFNATDEDVNITLPATVEPLHWQCLIDTNTEEVKDADGIAEYAVSKHSSVIFKLC
jgi:isoamylase/glycogen operon protein